jgi:hypothetical protein
MTKYSYTLCYSQEHFICFQQFATNAPYIIGICEKDWRYILVLAIAKSTIFAYFKNLGYVQTHTHTQTQILLYKYAEIHVYLCKENFNIYILYIRDFSLQKFQHACVH